MPVLGLGVFKAEAGEACRNAVLSALHLGYRHIDTAAIYNNEAAVGEAVRNCGLPRGEVFVTSKVPPPAWSTPSEAYDKTLAAVQASLAATGLEYLDLMLLHAAGAAEGRPEAWRALEAAQKQGLVRSIGVSNMGVPELTALAETATVPIAVNQIELHPWCWWPHVVDYCRAHNIQLQAYCPIAQGTKLDDTQLNALADRIGKSPAQVLLRWSLQKGFVPLPKSVTPARQAANADLFGWALSPADMALLDGWDTGASIMGAKLG